MVCESDEFLGLCRYWFIYVCGVLIFLLQHYSPPSPQPPGHYSYSQQTGTPRKWTPRASPVHTVRLIN